MKKKPTFVKLNRTEATDYLLERHPNAFLLLTQIALRARREPELFIDLDTCEAVIGDYKKIGLTHRQYRTALNVLVNDKLVVKHTTNKGTVVKLICSNIYDINIIEGDKQTTNKKSHERQDNDKPSVTPETPNKNDKNIKKERTKEEINIKDIYPFDYFWETYDKKVDKKPTLAKWKKIKDSDKEIIYKTVADYIKSKPDKKYRASPLVYLNKERWNDEIIINNKLGVKINGFNQGYYPKSSAGKPNDLF